VAVLTATVLLGGALAGCGGGAPERLSRAALVQEADQICAAGLREADRLRGETVPGARGEAAAAEFDANLAVLEQQVDGLADLRGPASTDADLERAVDRLEAAAAGLETLRDAAADDDLTVDEAVEQNPDVVQRVNRASAQANDALAALGFLGCIAFTEE
jgi:hypothetical protein